MLLTVAAILLLLWIVGLTVKVTGAVIHLLLLLALIAAVMHFVRGRKVV